MFTAAEVCTISMQIVLHGVTAHFGGLGFDKTP